MLHNPFSTPTPPSSARATLQLTGLQSLHQSNPSNHVFSDSRTLGYRGPSRSVTLYGASSAGGSAISKSPDGEQCVVAGKDSLRVLRISDGSERPSSEHKYAIGAGGFRIDASKNFWSGTGLKVDSALTDVAWCHKAFDTKILTSARNGEILLWDLQRSGPLKYESRRKAHTRSINKLSYSTAMPYYCSTGSSDGYLRVWDLRSLSKEFLHIHHSVGIRTVIFSPSILEPFHAITGLENGSLCRWDLRKGQKGLLERIPLAHTGAVLSLDWRDSGDSGGWLASAGLDLIVKIWDFRGDDGPPSRKPAYLLNSSYPVRRVLWRTGYETELAIASYNESAYNPTSKTLSFSENAPTVLSKGNIGAVLERNSPSSGITDLAQIGDGGAEVIAGRDSTQRTGDLIEIWDVRRPWIAKWTVEGSNSEGGVSDVTFADSHALWVQHPSGAFSQMDLRFCYKPLDAIPRTAVTWSPVDSLTFVADKVEQWEIPYDDTMYGPGAEKTEPNKRLGDKPYLSTSQTIGTIFDAAGSQDWDTFIVLARSYRIEGADKPNLCEKNAESAFEVGDVEAGRIWLLLRSLLIDLERSKPATPLFRKASASNLVHSISAPATVPTVKRSPLKTEDIRSSSSDPPSLIKQVTKKRSAGTTSISRGVTPYTSSPASPVLTPDVAGQEVVSPLGATTERDKTKRKTSSVSRTSRPRKMSLKRSSSSKADRSGRGQSSSKAPPKRLVGEGALDDSDEEGQEPSLASGQLSDRVQGKTSIESLASSVKSPSWSRTRTVWSPGLHDDNGWASDEKEDSVSPASSESESDNSVASTTAARSSSLKRPPRSRSSTLASMAASSIQKLQSHQDLQRTDSQSTVTAGADKCPPRGLLQDSEVDVLAETYSMTPSYKSRSRSHGGNAEARHAPSFVEDAPLADEIETRFLEWNHLAIKETEERYRLTAWKALRETVEQIVENGGVQLCATIACIASSELGFSMQKTLHLIEAYTDVLARFRLHEVLAYIRKFAPSSEIRKLTQVQTTMHSVCASCHKPLLQQALGRTEGVNRSWKGYSQCFECKRSTISCTICRFPVRSSLFMCSGCFHGGHRDCYYRLYKNRPLIELSTHMREGRSRRIKVSSASEGGSTSSPSIGGDGSLPDQLAITIWGHPCAAGCGHYCRTVNEKSHAA